LTRFHGGFSNPHYCLPSGLEFTRDLGDAGSGIQSLYDCRTFLRAERWRPTKLFASNLGANHSRLRSFHQQIVLELSHRSDHLHRHFSSGTGEINTTQRQARHAHAGLSELLDGGSNIHCIPPQSIQLGHYEHVIGLHPVDQLDKPGLSLAATEPLLCSSINRRGSIANPAALISMRWFWGDWLAVDTRQ
jgi:hypothetical protein